MKRNGMSRFCFPARVFRALKLDFRKHLDFTVHVHCVTKPKTMKHGRIVYRKTHHSCWHIGDLWLQCDLFSIFTLR